MRINCSEYIETIERRMDRDNNVNRVREKKLSTKWDFLCRCFKDIVSRIYFVDNVNV